MSIAIITLREDDVGNTLDISVEFEPPLSGEEEVNLTHLAALSAVSHLQEKLGSGEEEFTVNR